MVSKQAAQTIKKILRKLANIAKTRSLKVEEASPRMPEAESPAFLAEEEMLENAANEALEARLALLLATAPAAAQPAELSIYLTAASSVRVYTGCQRADPQAAS
jgi:hypothetical protein